MRSRRRSASGEDEHRLELKPILRRVYVPEGETPIADVNWRFQWLWLYAFVHPKTGESYWWILPYLNTELFNQVLADFAREFGLGANKHILLAVDRAGWQKAQKFRASFRTTSHIFTISLTGITTRTKAVDCN